MSTAHNTSMANAVNDIAVEFGERICVTVERDGDLVTGFNEDPRVITIVQLDVTEDVDPDMVRLKGKAASTLLDMLMRLVDPDQQRYRKVGPPIVIDLPLSCTWCNGDGRAAPTWAPGTCPECEVSA